MDIIETTLYTNEINNNFELIDCDWNDKYGLLLIIKNNRKFIIQAGENYINLTFKINCDYPLIRWIDYNLFLIADARNDGNRENLYILSTDGIKQNSFNCGDGIEDIVVSNDGIWISYFDEGVFGSGISTEGLVLFNHDGTPLFKYHNDLLNMPYIDDCYAMCNGKAHSVWIFPYSDFPLVNVNLLTKSIQSYKVPKKLHGSHAICIRGKFGYFYDRYNSNGELYCWEIGSKQPQLIGKLSGRTRGLDISESHHFLSFDESKIKLYKIINPNEYN